MDHWQVVRDAAMTLLNLRVLSAEKQEELRDAIEMFDMDMDD